MVALLRLTGTAMLIGLLSCSTAWGESTCYGTVGRGRLEGGVQLPASGANYSAYSSLGVALGRNYVHERVSEIVVAAYKALEAAAPQKTFVYGETAWRSGGRLRPHRTHQNGTSVDFMVPVLDQTGVSVPLPTGSTNKYGYGIEFDADARFDDYTIDFEAIGEHLYQLHRAATAQAIGISLVIFDRRYLPRLFETRHGAVLRALPLMKKDPWIRHDEHYHVDFEVRCKPLKG